MNKHLITLKNFKNPIDIFNYCNKHNINELIEESSTLWESLLDINFKNYVQFRIDTITLKDYYVLLYFIQAFNLLNDLFIIQKTQYLLSLLPIIYHGDHIAIIHAANNICIRNNKAKIIMFRTKDNQCTLPYYGNGFLKIKFINNTVDIYTDNLNSINIIPPYGVDLNYGGFNFTK